MLYVNGSQMLRHKFLLDDVDALMASGEVPGIFSTDEKHLLNEVKWQCVCALLQHMKTKKNLLSWANSGLERQFSGIPNGARGP